MPQTLHSLTCPFCSAPGLTYDGGAKQYRCRYCLETFEKRSGELARGYELLACGSFEEAEAYFSKRLDLPEAYYGLFLAEKQVEEIVSGEGAAYVVYSYQPAPLASDEAYVEARRKNAGDPGILRRLEAVEKARRETTDVVVCDVALVGGGRFADALETALMQAGYRTERAATASSAGIGVLRAARALLIAVCSEADAYAAVENKIVERFLRLKGKAAVDDKRAYLLHGFPLPDRVRKNLGGCLIRETAPSVDAAALLTELALPRPGDRTISVTGTTAAALRVSTDSRTVRFASVAPVENQAADLERLAGYLGARDFTDAARLITQLETRGCRNANFLMSKLLADCRLPSAEQFVAGAQTAFDSGKADRQTLAGLLAACASEDEAARYVKTLIGCALRCLEIGRLDAAEVYIGAAASAPASDAYADAVIDKMQSISHTAAFEPFSRLYLSACDMLRVTDGAFQYDRRAWLIGCALQKRQFAQAEAQADRLIALGGGTAETYRYKLLAQNGCADDVELIKPGVVLGDTFLHCVGAQTDADAAFELIGRSFDAFCLQAEAGALWPFPLLSELAALKPEGRGLDADRLLRAGEAALLCRRFELAESFFSDTIERDRTCYRAHWGLLKAVLHCESDARLPDCPTPITEVGNLYRAAYNLADAAGDTRFKEMLVSISARQSRVAKRDDHIFHREDHIIQDGRLVGYAGSGTPKVFLTGVDTVVAGAYAGSDVESLVLDGGVKTLEDQAFAGSSLRAARLPSALESVGVNPFSGCRGVTIEVYRTGTQQNARCEKGVLYFGDTAVAAFGQSPVLAPDTRRIGPKCFASSGAKRIDIPACVEAVSTCAFADSLLETVDGLREETCETDPNTFETPFAGRALSGSRISRAGQRWSGLYGGADNNMAGPSGTAPSGKRTLYTAGAPVTGGLLVRDGVIIFATGRHLNFLPLADAMKGGAVPGRIDLGTEIAGTGVLAGDDLIIPAGESCTLTVVSCGRVTRRIPLGRKLTRTLTASDSTVYAVLTNEIAAVDLTGGVVRAGLSDPVSGVPAVLETGGRRQLVFPAGRYLYALDGDTLETVGRFELRGMDYATNQPHLLCRGLTAVGGGKAYWFERHASSTVLGIYDGTAVSYKAVPARMYPNTQPILANGNLYAMVHGGYMIAEVRPTDRDWLFTYAGDLPAGAVNIAVVGDRVAANVPGERKEAFRAIADGMVLTVAAREGVIGAIVP